VPETIAEILSAHRARTTSPEETAARSYARIRARDDPAIFISLRDEAEVLAEAKRLAATGRSDLPLYGVPVAVKDNIDIKGLPTTAACPAYAYAPTEDATVVTRLRDAGAIVIGKTNLDQFATGLVGVRSPYGVPRNPFNPQLIPGGSSSGSAVAVASGIVPIAIGTDTAGSGRVPAGLNNIVGAKPSLGLVSTHGVVPACRSLDCVSVFALTVDDAYATLAPIAGPDARDPFSRDLRLGALSEPAPALRLAVPRAADRRFFGDRRAEAAFEAAIAAACGAAVTEIDLEPFLEAARLLYDGPWIAERFAAVGAFVRAQPADVHPVTHAIIVRGADVDAVDTFRAFYRLAELRVKARAALAGVDILMVPTVPAAYTVAEVEADPIALNTRLGTYTNFVNLLDLAGLAVPATIAADGTPFGVTLLAPAGQDAWLASFGRALQARSALPLGALGVPQPPLARLSIAPLAWRRRDRRRRRAPFRHAAQRRPARARRTLPGAHRNRAGLSAVRAAGCRAGKARPAAGCGQRGRRHRGGGLGAAAGCVRPLRRRGSASARHRNPAARRWSHRQGLPGGKRGGRRSARHFRLRRLAGLPAAGACPGLNAQALAITRGRSGSGLRACTEGRR
jgi:allophanate hydrolase